MLVVTVLYQPEDEANRKAGGEEHPGSAKEAETLASAREAALAAGSVVDPDLLPVGIDPAGNLIPGHYRERIRAPGPTIRRDLGPQAVGENAHVSL